MSHSIDKYDNKLPFKLSGLKPSKSTPALFFLPGFPDDLESFEDIASRYRKTHTVIQCCLPGYEMKVTKLGGGTLAQKWGWNFEEVVEMAKNTIVENTSHGQDVFVIAHDWGAIMAYFLAMKHPSLIKGMVGCDVGIPAITELPFKDLIVMFSYQFYLACAFIVSQLLSALLADVMVGIYPWKFVGPCPYEYKTPRRALEIRSWMCYPYFWLYFGRIWKSVPDPVCPTKLNIPFLFIFGKMKRVMFQSPSFFKDIENAQNSEGVLSASRVRCVENAGHWLHAQQTDRLEKEMNSFFTAIQTAKSGEEVHS